MKLPAPLLDFWQQREPRERLILQLGAVVLTVLLLVAMVISPLYTERGRLERVLPSLRTDAAVFKRDIAAAKGGSAVQMGGSLVDDMNFILASSGLSADSVKLEAASPNHISLRGKSVAWSSWIRLLDQARQRGAKVERFSAREAGSGVDVDAELSR